MIKKIGEKLELIHYLFFFLNSILYKKISRKKSEIFFYLDLILLHFIKKVYSTVVHIEQIPV